MVTNYYTFVKGIVHPKMKNLSLITPPHVVPNPSFIFETEIEMFLMLHRQQRNYLRGKIVHVINCYFMKLQEYFLCTKKEKRLYSTITLMCQSLMHGHKSPATHMWCCWRRSRRSDVECPSLLVRLGKGKSSSLSKSSDMFMKTSSSACKPGTAHPGSMSERRLLRQQHRTHTSW